MGAHPGPVSQHGPTGKRAGRINRENRNPLPLAPQSLDPGIDQAGLAGPGRAGKRRHHGLAGMFAQPGRQGLGLMPPFLKP